MNDPKYYIADKNTGFIFSHNGLPLGFSEQSHNWALFYAELLGERWEVVDWIPPWAVEEAVEVPWSKDISEELAVNPGPYRDRFLKRDNGWWERRLVQISGVTLHHTLSDSPHATAEHYIKKDGGRPTIPYTVWITQTGEVLLCVRLEEGLWHDHQGHANKSLSVGLAGKLHLYKPPDVQLDAAVKVCKWAIESPILLSVIDISQIKGHDSFYDTECPGWNSDKSGNWKHDFYRRLQDVL